MKKHLSLLLAVALMVSLFAVYMPAPISAASSSTSSHFFFDYTNGFTATTQNNPNGDSNTSATYDAEEKALKISTKGLSYGDKGYQYVGQMVMLPQSVDSNVRISQYPYFAVKVKVASDAVTPATVQMSARNGYSSGFGSILSPLDGYDDYQTGKWVLYICDGNTVLNHAEYNGDGRWLGNIFSITGNVALSDGTIKDLGWIQWAGAFATVADAQAYYDATTEVQDNIDGASDFFIDFSEKANVYAAYPSSSAEGFVTPIANASAEYDTEMGALKISTKEGWVQTKDANNNNLSVGTMYYYPETSKWNTVSFEDYPIFALKIKVTKTDMIPGRIPYAVYGKGTPYLRGMGTPIHYGTNTYNDQSFTHDAGTDDWQLVVFDALNHYNFATGEISGSTQNATNGGDYWCGFGMHLGDTTFALDPVLFDGESETLAYVSWAGAFESVEKAQAYFDETTDGIAQNRIEKNKFFLDYTLHYGANFYYPSNNQGLVHYSYPTNTTINGVVTDAYMKTTNSVVSYDFEENAVKLATANTTTKQGIGAFVMAAPHGSFRTEETTGTGYTVFAMKIKLARDDLGRMEMPYGWGNGFGSNFGQVKGTLTYDETDTDWQLLTIETTNMKPYWGGVNLYNLVTNTDIIAEGAGIDLAWIQWAGAFKSLEDAQVYYNQTSGIVEPIECTNAGIRKELDENGTQGLRFYQTLNTEMINGDETIEYNGETLKVRNVYVLMSTAKVLENLGKTPDELTAELAIESEKVKRIPITSCRTRVQSGDKVTYSFTAMLTNVKQQNKATDVCARAYLYCQRADGTNVNVYGNVQTTNVKEMYGAVKQSIRDTNVHTWMTGRSSDLFLNIENEASLDKIAKHKDTSYTYSPDSSSVLVAPAYDEASEGGTIGYNCTSKTNSVEQYPVVAMRVKLQNPNSVFGRLYWRTQESERMYYIIKKLGIIPAWEQSIYGLGMTYQATTDWQIVYADMSDVHNPYFVGNWTNMMCNLLPTHGQGVTTADGVYVDWMGAFASVEEVYAYANEAYTPVEKPEESLSELEQTAKDNAWKINNQLPAEMTKIPTEKAVINGYTKGVDEFSFQHHPSLVYFKGKWYAGYSNGVCDEDSPGQKMVYSTSTDFANWSDPIDLVVPGDAAMRMTNELPEMADLNAQGIISTQVIGGFAVVGDTLCFNYSVGEFYPESFDKNGNFIGMNLAKQRIQRQYSIYSTDGVTWSAPTAVSSLNRYSTFVQSPYGTKKQYSICGFRIHYADGAAVLNPKTRIPSGMMTEAQIASSRARCPGSLTETSYYQSPDGVLHLLCRSETGYIWAAESRDEGLSWSEFYPTNFTSASTMFTCIPLPDGRIAWVGSPYYDVRWPLTLYISDDGYNFDEAYILQDEVYTMQTEGYAKGGAFAYPQLVVKDNYLYVMYTKQKEVVEICRVNLSNL